MWYVHDMFLFSYWGCISIGKRELNGDFPKLSCVHWQTFVVHYVLRARKVGRGGVQLIRWEGGGWAADNSMAISQAGSVQLIDPPNCIPHCLTVSLPHILSCTSPIPSSWHHNSDSPIFQCLSAWFYGYSRKNPLSPVWLSVLHIDYFWSMAATQSKKYISNQPNDI